MVYTYKANGSAATKIEAKRQLPAYTYDRSQQLSQIQRYTGAVQPIRVKMGATAPFVDSTYGKLWAADYGYLGGSIYTGGPGQQGSAVLDDRSLATRKLRCGCEARQSRTYTMTVELRSRDLTDKHSLGNVTVYNDQASASKHPVEKKQEETIAFLREQQWSLEFATEVVSQRSERSGFEVPAEVQARAGGQGQVTDPLDGRLAEASATPVGQSMSRGDVLARIAPPTTASAGQG